MTGNREPTILLQPLHLRNRRRRVEMFQFRRRLLLTGNVATAIPFRTRSFCGISSRHSSPTKSGLAGKDIAGVGGGDLRVTELTRKGLDDFSLRCLSNRDCQSVVFVRSISEAVFVSNLLRHIRQDRTDLDAVAANMHGPAPPDKHKESARLAQPLLGEVVSTIKPHAPAPAASSSQSPESAELAKAKRKLQEAGIALTPEKKAKSSSEQSELHWPVLANQGS